MKIFNRLVEQVVHKLIEAGLIQKISLAIVNDMQQHVFEIFRLELHPGDRIIIKTKDVLSDSAIARIKEFLGEIFPDHLPVIILEDGLDLAVVRNNVQSEDG